MGRARGFRIEALLRLVERSVMQELPMESVERLSRVTKLLRTQRTLPAKLETIVAVATRTIRNCDAAG